jgi:hypothetical protein
VILTAVAVSSVQATEGLESLESATSGRGSSGPAQEIVAFTDLAALLACTGIAIPQQATWTPLSFTPGCSAKQWTAACSPWVVSACSARRPFAPGAKLLNSKVMFLSKAPFMQMS